MNSEKLYSINISTDADNGSILSELLPSVDLYPSSYFDCDDNIARLNLYYDQESQCNQDFILVKNSISEWAEISDLAPSKIDLSQGELVKEDWSEKWKEFFHVEKVSDRLVIKPSWEEYEASPSDVVIEIDPGMSFGTGNHGTTKACLQLLDKLTLEIQDSFLDMGCGSGILSMAASKLGVKKIDGFDYDENSVKIANENLVLSKCENVSLTLKNLYEIEPDYQYSLVIANILAPVLMDNVNTIVKSLSRVEKARLVLSGILHEQFPKVQELFENQGLELIDLVKIDKWSTGLFKFAKL
ncbi:MAG: 50S ribosomal protein L11 methyltransferase [Lentisphaeraceae bacterium]|nr:50S ribosomal protein L11 methyltransferase [Lentisphaeraceae bacterium]